MWFTLEIFVSIIRIFTFKQQFYRIRMEICIKRVMIWNGEKYEYSLLVVIIEIILTSYKLLIFVIDIDLQYVFADTAQTKLTSYNQINLISDSKIYIYIYIDRLFSFTYLACKLKGKMIIKIYMNMYFLTINFTFDLLYILKFYEQLFLLNTNYTRIWNKNSFKTVIHKTIKIDNLKLLHIGPKTTTHKNCDIYIKMKVYIDKITTTRLLMYTYNCYPKKEKLYCLWSKVAKRLLFWKQVEQFHTPKGCEQTLLAVLPTNKITKSTIIL